MSIATKNYLMLWNNACHLAMNTPLHCTELRVGAQKVQRNHKWLNGNLMFISSAVFVFCLVGHFRNTKCWSDKYLKRGEEALAMGPNFAVIITSRIFQKTAIEPLCSIVTSVSNLLDYWVHRKSRISPTSTILPSFWHHICIMLTRNLLRSTENVKNVVISCRSSLSECFRRSVEASQFAGVA